MLTHSNFNIPKVLHIHQGLCVVSHIIEISKAPKILLDNEYDIFIICFFFSFFRFSKLIPDFHIYFFLRNGHN